MGKKITIIAIILVALLAVSGGAWAQGAVTPAEEAAAPVMPGDKATSSGLPVPRFVSLASDKVFVRTGPALRYPIKWIYQREHMPVEIVQEFDTWRKIRDMDGDDGWVHQSLLSGDRAVIVKGESNLMIRKEASSQGAVVALLEPSVVAKADECLDMWCRISAGGYTGWAERKFLWGIYDDEDFD